MLPENGNIPAILKLLSVIASCYLLFFVLIFNRGESLATTANSSSQLRQLAHHAGSNTPLPSDDILTIE